MFYVFDIIPFCAENSQKINNPASGRDRIVEDMELTLAPLRGAAGFAQTRLLAFLAARIAGEPAFGLQDAAQVLVQREQGAGDAVADRRGLSLFAASIDLDREIIRSFKSGSLQRFEDDHLVCRGREILGQGNAIDGNVAFAAFKDADAGGSSLALAHGLGVATA